MNEWKLDDFVEINTYDDGNEKYQEYENLWIIEELMFGGGKVKLENFWDVNVIIPSISAWKVSESSHNLPSAISPATPDIPSFLQ